MIITWHGDPSTFGIQNGFEYVSSAGDCQVNNLAYNLSVIHVHMLTYGMDTHDMAHVQLYCFPYLDVVTVTPLGRDAIVDHVGQLDIMYCDYHMIQSQLTTLSPDSIPENLSFKPLNPLAISNHLFSVKSKIHNNPSRIKKSLNINLLAERNPIFVKNITKPET